MNWTFWIQIIVKHVRIEPICSAFCGIHLMKNKFKNFIVMKCVILDKTQRMHMHEYLPTFRFKNYTHINWSISYVVLNLIWKKNLVLSIVHAKRGIPDPILYAWRRVLGYNWSPTLVVFSLNAISEIIPK